MKSRFLLQFLFWGAARHASPVRAAMWLLSGSALLAQPYTISTIAGGGPPPSFVPALGVSVPVAGGIAANDAGDVYFSSIDSVLKVDAKGILTRLAGTGRHGSSGDGGPATSAQLAWPAGLAVDTVGNVYIAENGSHRIRRVSPDGSITTVAGTGSAGDSGDGGPAINAQLNFPVGVAVDTSGNLYIADTGNNRVRRVSAEGVITTVAAGFGHTEGIAADAAGNVYITDYVVGEAPCGDCDVPFIGRIVRVTRSGIVDTIAGGGMEQGDGGAATSALLQTPRGIAVDASGSLYVSDSVNDSVRKISPSGVITTAAGVNFARGIPCPYTDGPLPVTPFPLRCPAGVAVDVAGTLYVADIGNHRIRKVSPQGDIANIAGSGAEGTFWGDGGRAEDAALYSPLGVAVDGSSNLFIADAGNNRVRKVSPDGVITTIAGNGTPGYSGDGGPATSAQLRDPAGVAVDASGNLYIADTGNNRIRKVSENGMITTVAGRGDFNPPLGDGGPATRAALAGPRGVAVDASGNLYIADTFFFLIRKVSPAGIITTVAGRNFYQPGPSDVSFPTGVSLDAAGNLYITTSTTIRKLSRDGTISTVAGNGTAGISGSSGDGGPATSAVLQGPIAAAVDAAGNLYISGGLLSGLPTGAAHVRRVTSDGIINTIAGNGSSGYSGDGGPANSASFSAAAAGIAVDAAGTIYVADVFNNVIRALRPASAAGQ
jgi:sugar lactone lactonase YvrE